MLVKDDGPKGCERGHMIDVTRLDGRSFTINADMIEVIESNPDTFIRLVNGNSYLVRESRQEVVARVIAFRRRIFQAGISLSESAVAGQR